MPGFNQKGPEGAGPMTGRQRGMCRRTEDQLFAGDSGDRMNLGKGMGRRRGLGLGLGQGLGQGSGQGLGLCRRFAGGSEPPQNREDNSSTELSKLQEQHQAAQRSLSAIEEKIAALKSEK